MTTTPGLDRSPWLRAQVPAWNVPFAPFTIAGNVHFVGASGVSAFLITTSEGHILLDGGLAETVPQITVNIATLGFRIRDVRYLLNSHAHFDHSGGLAALKAASGARMIASQGDRSVLESGHIEFGPASEVDTAPVSVDRVIADGHLIVLGSVTLTALITPGHTRGCTSYALVTRATDGMLRRVFFHCSSTVSGHRLVPESYPGMVADYRRTFDRLSRERADIFLANHPDFFQMKEKRARQLAGDANAFVDTQALGAFNREMRQAFERELARQKTNP
ncbi:MAG: subclass B3 metallo-beta-lactamase [Longimicrobiales bacterium]